MGNHYYPRGGMSDYAGDYETIGDALNRFRESGYEWAEVVEFETIGTPGYNMIEYRKTSDGNIIRNDNVKYSWSY